MSGPARHRSVVARVRSFARRRPAQTANAIAALGAAFAMAGGALVARPDVLAAPLVSREAEPSSADVIFVFSGDVDFKRTRFAAALFARTHARRFVVSGAGVGGDSAEEMAAVAAAAGVPREAIAVEPTARTTHENAVLSTALVHAGGTHRVVVVTSPFHSRRASMAARRAWPDLEVVSVPVPDGDPRDCSVSAWPWDPACRTLVTREWEKLAWYGLRGWL